MAKLGYLGLGIMGGPMARHLLKAGHEVALWSNTPEKARQMAEAEKGVCCSTPRAVGEQAEIIFLCVGDSTMSEQVLLGLDGVASAAKGPHSVKTVVDASTISPSVSRKIGVELQKYGISYLDAPCTGSKAGAEGGTLTFMVGGDPLIYESIRPYLEIMGKRLFYCGAAGFGLNAKLTQNLILSNVLQAFNEGIIMSTKAGVDPELMLEVLANSAARTGAVEAKAPAILDRNFATNFSIKWMHKDIRLMLDNAAELEVPLPLTAQTAQQFQAAISLGHGEEDIASSIKVLETITGVEVRRITKS